MEDTKSKNVIIAISVIIPLAVASLFGIHLEGYDFSFLPPIYATINAVTALVLVMAFWQVKQGNFKKHEYLIKTAMGLTTLFLLMYIAYHITSESTHYGGEGMVKYLYFFILITHILLSVIVIPFVLFAFYFGIANLNEKHKKIVRIAFPMWLYVATTGVIVFLMISPYME